MTPYQNYNKKLAIYTVTKTVTRNSNVFRVVGSYIRIKRYSLKTVNNNKNNINHL